MFNFHTVFVFSAFTPTLVAESWYTLANIIYVPTTQESESYVKLSWAMALLPSDAQLTVDLTPMNPSNIVVKLVMKYQGKITYNVLNTVQCRKKKFMVINNLYTLVPIKELINL